MTLKLIVGDIFEIFLFVVLVVCPVLFAIESVYEEAAKNIICRHMVRVFLQCDSLLRSFLFLHTYQPLNLITLHNQHTEIYRHNRKTSYPGKRITSRLHFLDFICQTITNTR